VRVVGRLIEPHNWDDYLDERGTSLCVSHTERRALRTSLLSNVSEIPPKVCFSEAMAPHLSAVAAQALRPPGASALPALAPSGYDFKLSRLMTSSAWSGFLATLCIFWEFALESDSDSTQIQTHRDQGEMWPMLTTVSGGSGALCLCYEAAVSR
jgi:hypothetical protein